MAYDDQTTSYGNGYLVPDPTEWITHSLLGVIDSDETKRKQRFARAWQAYYGQLDDTIAREWKPGQKRKTANDNVQINNARLVVDRGVEFLAGKGHEIEYDTADPEQSAEPGQQEDTPEDLALDAFWAQNGGDLTFQKLAQNGGVCGHTFAKLTEPPLGEELPGLEVVDPSNVDVVWDPDDFTSVWEYRITWTSVDPTSRQPRAKRERHVRVDRGRTDSTWEIIDEESVNNGAWVETGRSDWPYPFSAVVDCQNLPCANEFWGLADLEEDVIGLCEAINRNASNLNRLLRLHAHRHWWASGVRKEDKIDLAPDTLIRLASENAKMGALEVLGDLTSAIEYYRELKQALYEVTSVPPVATGKLESIGQLSGLALGILYGPLIAKTEKKQGTYGGLLVEISRRALWLAGYQAAMVVVHWPELVPADPIAEREAFILDQQLGVSKATILEKLGYDPELEAQKRQVEEQEALAQAQAAFNAGGQVDPTVQQPPPTTTGG